MKNAAFSIFEKNLAKIICDLSVNASIETTDPVYTFCEVINHVDLNKYLTTKDSRLGRPRYDEETLLKVILFAFMEDGYESLRKIEKLCKSADFFAGVFAVP